MLEKGFMQPVKPDEGQKFKFTLTYDNMTHALWDTYYSGVDYRAPGGPRLIERRDPDKYVLCMMPHVEPNPEDPQYWKYCEWSLTMFKKWRSQTELMDEKTKDPMNPTEQDWIRSWKQFRNKVIREKKAWTTLANHIKYEMAFK